MADGRSSEGATPTATMVVEPWKPPPMDDPTFVRRMFDETFRSRRRTPTAGLSAGHVRVAPLRGPDGDGDDDGDEREHLGRLLQPYVASVRDAEQRCRAASHGPTKASLLSEALVLVRFVIVALEQGLEAAEHRDDRAIAQDALRDWRQKHKNLVLGLNRIDYRVSVP